MSRKKNTNAKEIAKKAGISRAQFFRILGRNDVFFSSLPAKSVWDEKTVQNRFAFAVKHHEKPKSFWRKFLFLDNKQFRLYCTKQSKEYCVRRSKKGVWKHRGERLGFKLSKPRKTMRCGSGAPTIQVTCGVHFSGSVFFTFTRGRWNARSAKCMYLKLGRFFDKTETPKCVVEDNDPSGYSSRIAIRTKNDLRIRVLKLPQRSPELQPLDFSVWDYVENAMARNNDRLLRTGKGAEQPNQYLARLRKTFLRLPHQYLKNTIDDVQKRVVTLYRLHGDVFTD